MAAELITMTQSEYIIYWVGWIFATFFALVCMLFTRFTPAKVFLRAWWSKSPVAEIHNMLGMKRFENATMRQGYMDVKRLGPVSTKEGDFTFESNSKAAVFTFFEEVGVTTPKEFPAIIEEIRSKGVPIHNFKQYQQFLEGVTDDEARKKYLEKINDRQHDKIIKVWDDLKENGIRIGTYKTIKQHELQNMFPFNASPIIQETMLLGEMNIQMKKMQRLFNLAAQAMPYAIAVLVIIIAFVILWKMVLSGSGGSIIQSVSNIGGGGNIDI